MPPDWYGKVLTLNAILIAIVLWMGHIIAQLP
jgi:hypothetical protein